MNSFHKVKLVTIIPKGLKSLTPCPQHHMDSAIGVHIIDRWTYYALEFLEQVTPGSRATLKEFVSHLLQV